MRGCRLWRFSEPLVYKHEYNKGQWIAKIHTLKSTQNWHQPTRFPIKCLQRLHRQRRGAPHFLRILAETSIYHSTAIFIRSLCYRPIGERVFSFIGRCGCFTIGCLLRCFLLQGIIQLYINDGDNDNLRIAFPEHI